VTTNASSNAYLGCGEVPRCRPVAGWRFGGRGAAFGADRKFECPSCANAVGLLIARADESFLCFVAPPRRPFLGGRYPRGCRFEASTDACDSVSREIHSLACGGLKYCSDLEGS